jgi:hypothetical protein
MRERALPIAQSDPDVSEFRIMEVVDPSGGS